MTQSALRRQYKNAATHSLIHHSNRTDLRSTLLAANAPIVHPLEFAQESERILR